MDLLKGELQRKRKAAADVFGGKGFVRRSELEQRQLQKRRDEHRRKLLVNPARSPESASGTGEPGAAAGGPSPSSSASVTPAALDLPRHEVVRRLRVLRQPVTLFGEDDAARVERLSLVLQYGLVDDIDMAEGQANEFLRDVIETHKAAGNAKGRRVGGGAAADGDDGTGSDKDSERMNTDFEELCDEDRILVFFKRLLNDWKQELDAMTEQEKRTADGKFMIATFQQRARDINPLFDLCRKKVSP
jgi:pre-mRNA-splicing factor 18